MQHVLDTQEKAQSANLGQELTQESISTENVSEESNFVNGFCNRFKDLEHKVSKVVVDYISLFDECQPGDFKDLRDHNDIQDVWLSVFNGKYDNDPKQSGMRFDQFFQMLEKPVVTANKDSVRLFSGAKYPDGCKRAGDAVESVSVLAFDYDKATSLQALDDALEAFADVPAIVYTTHSHSSAQTKFRLVVPLGWPIPANCYKDVHKAVGDWLASLSDDLQYDPAPANPASMFYFPSHKPGNEFVFKHTDGFMQSGRLWENPFDWMGFLRGQKLSVVLPPEPKKPVANDTTETPSARLVCKRCAVMREEFETGGQDTQEPLWFGVLKIAAHCSPDISVELSDGHPKFSHSGLEAKMARIRQEESKPALCSYLSQHSELCKSCEWFGKIKSPVALGFSRLPKGGVQ